MKLIFLIPAIFLCIVPFFKFPYGIYTLLRIVVTLSAAFIIYDNYKKTNNVNTTIVLFSIILIVFNPIFPIRLSREIWLPIDLITAAIYFYHYMKIRKQNDF
jgi:uncharacterized membrane protein YobD (UPF0266 family)